MMVRALWSSYFLVWWTCSSFVSSSLFASPLSSLPSSYSTLLTSNWTVGNIIERLTPLNPRSTFTQLFYVDATTNEFFGFSHQDASTWPGYFGWQPRYTLIRSSKPDGPLTSYDNFFFLPLWNYSFASNWSCVTQNLTSGETFPCGSAFDAQFLGITDSALFFYAKLPIETPCTGGVCSYDKYVTGTSLHLLSINRTNGLLLWSQTITLDFTYVDYVSNPNSNMLYILNSTGISTSPTTWLIQAWNMSNGTVAWSRTYTGTMEVVYSYFGTVGPFIPYSQAIQSTGNKRLFLVPPFSAPAPPPPPTNGTNSTNTTIACTQILVVAETGSLDIFALDIGTGLKCWDLPVGYSNGTTGSPSQGFLRIAFDFSLSQIFIIAPFPFLASPNTSLFPPKWNLYRVQYSGFSAQVTERAPFGDYDQVQMLIIPGSSYLLVNVFGNDYGENQHGDPNPANWSVYSYSSSLQLTGSYQGPQVSGSSPPGTPNYPLVTASPPLLWFQSNGDVWDQSSPGLYVQNALTGAQEQSFFTSEPCGDRNSYTQCYFTSFLISGSNLFVTLLERNPNVVADDQFLLYSYLATPKPSGTSSIYIVGWVFTAISLSATLLVCCYEKVQEKSTGTKLESWDLGQGINDSASAGNGCPTSVHIIAYILGAISLTYTTCVAIYIQSQTFHKVEDFTTFMAVDNIASFRNNYLADCPNPTSPVNTRDLCFCSEKDSQGHSLAGPTCDLNGCPGYGSPSCNDIAQSQCLCNASIFTWNCGCQYPLNDPFCSSTTFTWSNEIQPAVQASFENCSHHYTQIIRLLWATLGLAIGTAIILVFGNLSATKCCTQKVPVDVSRSFLGLQVVIAVISFILLAVTGSKASAGLVCAGTNGFLQQQLQGCVLTKNLDFGFAETEMLQTISSALSFTTVPPVIHIVEGVLRGLRTM